jgi:hypothetical protein
LWTKKLSTRKERRVEVPLFPLAVTAAYTDKKENQILLIYKEIQNGAVEKSNGLLIYGEIFAHLLIC